MVRMPLVPMMQSAENLLDALLGGWKWGEILRGLGVFTMDHFPNLSGSEFTAGACLFYTGVSVPSALQ